MSNIKTLQFEEFINAPIEKVWDAIVNKEKYEQWTVEFTEGSTFEGSWEEGSEIRFLDPKSGGMIEEIAENRQHEFISIKHLGMIENGVPDYEGAKDWAPAYENYTFTEKDGGTLIHVDQDILPEYEEMFLRLWPNALKKLKEICEA